MNSKTFLDETKKIQETILDFLDDEGNNAKFMNLQNLFFKLKIREDKYKLKTVLRIIAKISNNHHRTTTFFSKIEQILNFVKDQILRYYSNTEIFNIFKNNKRVLLFLIESKLIKIDNYIIQIIISPKYVSQKYPEYFIPELKPFITSQFIKKNKLSSTDSWLREFRQELPTDFQEKRKIGENEDFICQMIREDSAEDFISYVSQFNLSYTSSIPSSAYETNSFLLKRKDTTFLEYAAFFGSVQILRYLQIYNVELTDSLWTYAIHSNSEEMIELLVDNDVKPPGNEPFKKLLIEAIKCHHNRIAKNINENESFTRDICIQCLKHYNVEFIQVGAIEQSLIYQLCEFDYYCLVSVLLRQPNHQSTADEMKALNASVEKGNADMVQLLLTDKKLNPNVIVKDNKKTLLHLAVEQGNVEIVRALLTSNSLDLNAKNKKQATNYYKETEIDENTALFEAVENENVEIVKLFLANDKVDINMTSKKTTTNRNNFYITTITVEEKTALFLAVEKKNIEIVRLLLSSNKIDPNIVYGKTKQILEKTKESITTKEEKTAFYAAVEKQQAEIIKLFLANAKINANIACKKVDMQGEVELKTPAYYAIEKGKIDTIRLLLTNEKIDPNAGVERCDKFGTVQTKKAPLHLAVQKRHITMIKLLVQNKKIDMNVQDEKGEIAADFARDENIKQLLVH